MKNIIAASCVVAFGMACAFAQQPAPQKVSPKKTSGWVSTLAKAREEAETLKQPVFVFCTDESPKSQEVENKLINSTRFRRFSADNLVMYRLVKNDTTADAATQKQHTTLLKNVRSTCPGFVVTDAAGKTIYKGYKMQNVSDGAFLSDLKEILENYDYAVNDAALAGYKPPAARTPTPSDNDPSQLAPPPKKPAPKKR